MATAGSIGSSSRPSSLKEGRSGCALPAALISYTPEQFEDVLKTYFEVFDKSPFMNDILQDLLGAGAFFGIDGLQWVHQRKTASNLFSLRLLRESTTESIQKHALVLNSIFGQTAASNRPVERVSELIS